MHSLIIDTDPGVDDAQAILMAAAHPDTSIEALLTVGGNVGLEHTTRNAFRILEIAGVNAPVHAGCEHALVRSGFDAAYVHGHDGLGDVDERPQRTPVSDGHAAIAVIELARRSPGEHTLVTLGPLTNIAIAVRLDPELPTRLARTVSMIGAVTGGGNTPIVTAEFNAYADPEAAFVVFDAWGRAGCEIEVVDWEATVGHPIPAQTVDRWNALGTDRAVFNERITSTKRSAMADVFGHNDLLAADPLAMAVALDPSGVLEAERHHLTVETIGEATRGQTVVDWRDRHGRTANAEIVMRYDQDRFVTMFERALA